MCVEAENTENNFKDENELEDTGREDMAKKTAEGRKGAVKNRVQMLNPRTGRWVKVDTETWKIIEQKKTPGPYKGIRKLKPTYRVEKTKRGVAVTRRPEKKRDN